MLKRLKEWGYGEATELKEWGRGIDLKLFSPERRYFIDKILYSTCLLIYIFLNKLILSILY